MTTRRHSIPSRLFFLQTLALNPWHYTKRNRLGAPEV
jgi:hypothetical protein